MKKQLLPTTGRYLEVLLTQLLYVADSAFHFEVIVMMVLLLTWKIGVTLAISLNCLNFGMLVFYKFIIVLYYK